MVGPEPVPTEAECLIGPKNLIPTLTTSLKVFLENWFIKVKASDGDSL